MSPCLFASSPHTKSIINALNTKLRCHPCVISPIRSIAAISNNSIARTQSIHFQHHQRNAFSTGKENSSNTPQESSTPTESQWLEFLAAHNMYPSKEAKLEFAKEHSLDWEQFHEHLSLVRQRARHLPGSAHYETAVDTGGKTMSNKQGYLRLRALLNDYIHKQSTSTANTLSQHPLAILKSHRTLYAMSKQTGLSVKKVRRAVRKFLLTGTLTRTKKLLLLDWLRQNNMMQRGKPSPSDMKHLVELLHLSKDQIHSQIRQIQDRKGKITREHRLFLKNLLHTKGRQWIFDNMEHVAEQTSLGKTQLQNAVFRLHYAMEASPQPNNTASGSRRKRVSQDVVRKLKAYLAANNFEQPMGDEWEKLQSEYPLNRLQLYNLIYRLRTKHMSTSENITEEARKIVQQWIDSHPDLKRPSKQEFQHLSSQTNLDMKQLYALFKRLREKKGEITEEKKKFIQEYLESKHGHDNDYDLEYLAKKTHLQIRQISSIIYFLKHPNGELTMEKKKMIRERFMASGYVTGDANASAAVPPIDFVSALAHDLQLSMSQVRNTIRQLQDPPGKMTAKKKKQIVQQLSRTYSEDANTWNSSKDALQQLAQEHGLATRQIQRMIYYERKKWN